MARGRKPALTLEEQIAALEAQIDEHKQAIEQLRAQLKEARAAKQEQDTAQLLAAIKKSGKSLEEVMEALKN